MQIPSGWQLLPTESQSLLMRIAFYAPLKSPNHPVPSGDRQMARLLIAALELAGHSVDLASELRSFTATPEDSRRGEIAAAAAQEVERLGRRWEQRPDVWLSYHPYYKAPDLIGPRVAAALNIPYVTAEASFSQRRARSGWAALQSLVADAVRQADVNLCFTERDRQGLAAAIPEARLERLFPFIDVAPFKMSKAQREPRKLVTVAMMRSGDKLESYRILADALMAIEDEHWTLTIIGDGPAASETRALFSKFKPERIEWLGEQPPGAIRSVLQQASVYVWPGVGEAYGIAYMEAQAAGVPVVAQAVAGVPEVVKDGETGILTPAGDTQAYARAIATSLDDEARRTRMGSEAHRFIAQERSLEGASVRLDQILRQYLGQHNGN